MQFPTSESKKEDIDDDCLGKNDLFPGTIKEESNNGNIIKKQNNASSNINKQFKRMTGSKFTFKQNLNQKSNELSPSKHNNI